MKISINTIKWLHYSPHFYRKHGTYSQCSLQLLGCRLHQRSSWTHAWKGFRSGIPPQTFYTTPAVQQHRFPYRPSRHWVADPSCKWVWKAPIQLLNQKCSFLHFSIKTSHTISVQIIPCNLANTCITKNTFWKQLNIDKSGWSSFDLVLIPYCFGIQYKDCFGSHDNRDYSYQHASLN